MQPRVPSNVCRPDSSWRETQPGISSDSRRGNGTTIEEWSVHSSIPSVIQRTGVNEIEIDGRDWIYSVAFLLDGKYIVSGGWEDKIRRWRVETGKQAGTPQNTRGTVFSISASRDEEWVVSGTSQGWVVLRNAESNKKVVEFKAHDKPVHALDISPDGKTIATGSKDSTVCLWSLDGKRLLGPLQHGGPVVGVRFSPDGHLIATAAWEHKSVRIYHSQNGRRLFDIPIQVNSQYNQSLAWMSDSKLLFVLSQDGHINRFDVSTGRTLAERHVHSTNNPRCIALASSGAFIASSASSSVSFWDTKTHQRIGSIIGCKHDIWSMTISANHDLVAGGDKKITLFSLHGILPPRYLANQVLRKEETSSVTPQKINPEETIKSTPTDDKDDKFAQRGETVQQLLAQLAGRDKHVQQLQARLEHTEQKNRDLIEIIRVHEQKYLCEALYAQGNTFDAAESFLGIVNLMNDGLRANGPIMNWITEFTNRCVSELVTIGGDALNADRHVEACAAYSAALSLAPSAPGAPLIAWAKIMLARHSVGGVLIAAAKFPLPRFIVYQAICDALYKCGRIAEAVDCCRHMQIDVRGDTSTRDESVQWERDFQRRCVKKLEKLGDTAMDSKKLDKAIKYYSYALSFDVMHSDVLIKCCKARAGLLEEKLVDATKVVELDPASYRGYKKKYIVLHCMGRHREAFRAFKTMLSKLEDSPLDPHICNLRRRYTDATPRIRQIVQQTIRHMPRVLINTTSGHLCDKTQLAAAFEKLPVFHELRSSMITRVDDARVQREVKEFYRYVMFSHKWEDGEPLFQTVENISIYLLGPSFTNIKLQTLCELVRSLGFQWVWSDTCCIDRKDNVVLQESLVAMFTWYRGSSLTVVYLRGVSSLSQKLGDLRRSTWNTRAWTYQEYVAAETVQFYTEDWKPYLGLTMYNHKESPIIVSEMQQATGALTAELMVLRPGLQGVREKLYVASGRQTSLVEDIGYSLIGIFNAAIPVIYGEGNRAVGRLLEHILTGSGDVTILAWTGRSGNYNSSLPVDLSVYNQVVPLHVPQPVEAAEMDSVVAELRSSLPDLTLAMTLHARLNELTSPFFAASRLRLPSITFPVTDFVCVSESDSGSRVYRAATSTLGDVEIKTADDLSGMEDFLLIHPWISPLLDQDFSRRAAGVDDTTRALRLVARLRRQFGALLLAPMSRVQYKRVATDALIMVQVCETSLNELVDGIQVVDIQ